MEIKTIKKTEYDTKAEGKGEARITSHKRTVYVIFTQTEKRLMLVLLTVGLVWYFV